MSEEYEEVVDFKKIGLVAVIIILGALSVVFAVGYLQEGIELNLDLDFQEETIFDAGQPEVQEQIPDQIEPGKGVIKDEYFQYLDFGLSIDDIIDIQDMPCSVFGGNQSLSDDRKYQTIFEQRKAECGL